MGNVPATVSAGGLAVTKFERLNSVLGYEFDRYVMEHPGFAEKIPLGATVILQLEGNDAYNRWSRRIAEKNLLVMICACRAPLYCGPSSPTEA